jgi:hypothetical protein
VIHLILMTILEVLPSHSLEVRVANPGHLFFEIRDGKNTCVCTSAQITIRNVFGQAAKQIEVFKGSTKYY